MARNGTGTFVRLRSWIADRDADIKITAVRHDEEDDGIATALTESIARDGQTTTTARVPFLQGVSISGTVSLPGLSVIGDPDSGLYTIGTNNIGLALGGAKVVDFATAGIAITGTLSASGGFSGALTATDGTVSAPGIGFTSDPDNGAYRIGTNNWALAVGGSKVVDLATTGVAITGTLSTTSGISITGTLSVTGALTYGGVTLSNAVTGTGNMVLSINSTLVSPILGTPTSGTLTNCTLPVGGITGLGTGIATFLATPGAGVATFLATPSSANLISAITDETGTGPLIFANTPTLVTPILGTPTSGTLTNCTLPVGGITGLAASVATFLATPSSANLIAAMTDETGTGPNVFANTPTLVTPVLGVATATSINKLSITAPATSATLVVANGKTATISNTLTFTGTDTSSVELGTGGTVLYVAGNATLTGGFDATSFSAGTKSSGTFTPIPLSGNHQHYTNGGAHTLAPPATTCRMFIEIINNASAGVISTPSFTKVDGDAFTTTNGHVFIAYITRVNSTRSHLNVKALQ